jgi:N-acyl homoserine lactone hydrolase
MRIHAITTGHVQIRERMRRGVPGPARRAAMFTGPWTAPLPIHAWLIEHEEGPILIDTGELAEVRDAPFARFSVEREQEIGPSLKALGVEPGDVRTVVLTHLHGDHMNGLPALPGARVLISAAEARYAASPGARVIRAATRQPLPAGFDPEHISFDGPALGGFPASRTLTADGAVQLVPAPGHTPGHMAVLVIEGELHRLIAGDCSYDQAQLLELRVDAVSPRASVARETMENVLRHNALHPTVYLPSHDPAAVDRLRTDAVLPRPALRT